MQKSAVIILRNASTYQSITFDNSLAISFNLQNEPLGRAIHLVSSARDGAYSGKPTAWLNNSKLKTVRYLKVLRLRSNRMKYLAYASRRELVLELFY